MIYFNVKEAYIEFGADVNNDEIFWIV